MSKWPGMVVHTRNLLTGEAEASLCYIAKTWFKKSFRQETPNLLAYLLPGYLVHYHCSLGSMTYPIILALSLTVPLYFVMNTLALTVTSSCHIH